MESERTFDSSKEQFNYIAASEAVAQGWLSKASRMLRIAIDHSAPDLDPSLLATADDLAERHFKAGDYRAAASLYRSVLAAKTLTLGHEHSDVRKIQQKLVQALWQTGGLSPELLAEHE